MSGLPLCRAVPLAHPPHITGRTKKVPTSPQLNMVPMTWLVTLRIHRNPQECRRHPGCRLLPVPAPSTASKRQIPAKNGSCCPFRGRGGGGGKREGDELGYPRKAPNLHPKDSGTSAIEHLGGREDGKLKEGDRRHTKFGSTMNL